MIANVLYIDTGTDTGFAISKDGKYSSCGCVTMKDKSHKTSGGRFLKFYNFIEETLESESIDLIVYEKVHAHFGTDAAHMFGGWEAILLLIGERKNIPVHHYAVKTIKKVFTGKGSASKTDVLVTANNIYGLNLEIKKGDNKTNKDSNTADAISIMHTYLKDVEDGTIVKLN